MKKKKKVKLEGVRAKEMGRYADERKCRRYARETDIYICTI